MKFIIITKYGSYIIDADDFDQAVEKAYDNHTGYRDVEAIVKVPDNDEM